MAPFKTHTDQVNAFMIKHDFTRGVDLHDCPNDTDVIDALSYTASEMFKISRLLEKMQKFGCNDVRIQRAQLYVEEIAELFESFITKNKVDCLDGLSDVEFINQGTAIAFGMPLEQGHLEVCRSNLTKEVRKEDDPRLRDKGPNYSPPLLHELVGYCPVCKKHPVDPDRGTCIDCSH